MTTQIEKYETQIARDKAQEKFYRDMAKSAAKPDIRASYETSANSLAELTARHEAKLAELRGDSMGQLTIFDAA